MFRVLALLFAISIRAAEPALLDELQRRAFDFFWFEAHPKTGLIKDRAGNHAPDEYFAASIASTGFGLAALPIGVERGWITRKQGQDRALLTLRFVHDKLKNKHGWLFHFVDFRTGERLWNCELSSIDTTLLLTGILTVGQYFGGETRELAQKIYHRVDFDWMRTDGGTKPNEKTLSMGWRPENGWINSRWRDYNEHLVLNLLAIGSPTHPIPADCWKAWKRQVGEYKGHKTLACGPLFTHQYSQAFVDFRGRKDSLGFNYFDSSIQATLANRQFCIDEGYGPNMWGLSATDKPDGGYDAYGAPPGEAKHDGTISPWNTAAAIVFTPDLVMAAVRNLRENHPQLWGRYGFSSAYNAERKWVAPDVIGIDAGAAILMIENHRTGLIWKLFMSLPEMKTALARAELFER